MKNNAKKRKLYEAFIETLPLLTSLEVKINIVLQHLHSVLHIYSKTVANQICFMHRCQRE